MDSQSFKAAVDALEKDHDRWISEVIKLTEIPAPPYTMVSKTSVDIEATQRGLLEMAGWYLDKASPRSPTASPVFADLTGCPPFFCVVGSEEILLDDSVRLVRAGGFAGVDARLWIAAGMQHVFPIWKGAFPEADMAIASISSWISERTR
jgi:acetyl esterase/lipase